MALLSSWQNQNKQNQTGPIQLFNTHFVLICTNKNFVVRPVLKKKRDAASLILS